MINFEALTAYLVSKRRQALLDTKHYEGKDREMWKASSFRAAAYSDVLRHIQQYADGHDEHGSEGLTAQRANRDVASPLDTTVETIPELTPRMPWMK